MHSKHEQARRHRTRDKKADQATAEFGVDEFTRLLLYKMISNQLLEKVNGVISIGMHIYKKMKYLMFILIFCNFRKRSGNSSCRL